MALQFVFSQNMSSAIFIKDMLSVRKHFFFLFPVALQNVNKTYAGLKNEIQCRHID